MMDAAVQAIESVDDAFGKLLAATQAAKGTLLITADHGNVEQMLDLRTGEPHTAHTTNPVPFIVADFSGRVDNKIALGSGALADVAPTVLQLMNLPQPQEMTGKPLLRTLTTSK
jgi:2,3-bisphosphoglycerate-independent phosphoglycerate mutase